MYICEKCGEVFTESACDLANDKCPTCGSGAYDEAVRCIQCGEWIPMTKAHGYSRRMCCTDCINERKEDIEFLVKATDDMQDVEIPMLYRYIFTDDDIQAILYRAAKDKLTRGEFDASDFIDDYANDIAETLDKGVDE